MKHIDLFSGIGGFALACEWAGIETIGFVEIDAFCHKVLKKHWPDVPIVEDVNNVEEIKQVIANAQAGGIQARPQQSSETSNIRGLDTIRRDNDNGLLLTAGFPCQPFSAAGRRKGSADSRYLWPQTLAVIEAVKPDWVLLENVVGILSMVFPDSAVRVASQASFCEVPNDEIADYNTIAGRIDGDLRQAGYETVWLVIPACAINAPHRRDRVWVVAHAEHSRGTRAKVKGENTGLQPSGSSRSELCDLQPQGENSLRDDGRGDGSTEAEVVANSFKPRARGNQQEIADEGRRVSSDRGEGIRQGDGEISTSGIDSTDKYAPANSPNLLCNGSNDNSRVGMGREKVSQPRNSSRESIVANSNGQRSGTSECRINSVRQEKDKEQAGQPQPEHNGHDGTIAKPQSRESWEQPEPKGREDTSRGDSEGRDAPNSNNEGLQGNEQPSTYCSGFRQCESPESVTQCDRVPAGWAENWYEVATRFCRVDDGIPRVVDRVERLKALGNAIVPEVAYQIMKTIVEADSLL